MQQESFIALRDQLNTQLNFGARCAFITPADNALPHSQSMPAVGLRDAGRTDTEGASSSKKSTQKISATIWTHATQAPEDAVVGDKGTMTITSKIEAIINKGINVPGLVDLTLTGTGNGTRLFPTDGQHLVMVTVQLVAEFEYFKEE